MSWLKTTSKRALESVIAGLNRADELGGEVRDFIQDRVLTDERYVRLRKRIAEVRGNAYTSKAEHQAAAQAKAAAAARVAPAPGAGAVKDKKGLGDPAIPAQIYGKSSCPWTGRAIRLLEDLKVDYDFIDLDDAEHAPHENRLRPETKQNTAPWVFLRGQFIGGFNALSEVHRLGQLEYLLLSEEQKKSANPAMQSVVITPRPNTDEVAPGEAS